MASNTRYALRATTKEVIENDLKKKQNTEKVTGNLVSTSRSPQSTLKIPTSTSSGARKSERLAKTPSPISRPIVSRKTLSSSSPGQKQAAKKLSFFDEKRNKEKKTKDARRVTVVSDKADFPEVGKKRKNMTGHSYKTLYKVQRKEELVPDTDRAFEAPDKLSMDNIVTDKVVDGPLCGDGLQDSQTGLSLKETLSDHKRIAKNLSSIMNVDSLESDCSTSLRDGIVVHSEIGEKCPDPNDIIGVMDGSEKLSEDATVMDNIVDQPPDGDGLNDSRISIIVDTLPTNSSPLKNMDSFERESSTCSGRLQDVISETASEMSPFLEMKNDGLCGICIVCSKRKRVSSGSTEINLCCCGATVNEDQGRLATCKDAGDHEAAVTSESAENSNSGNVSKEPHSDNLIDARENVCANCDNSGKIPRCCDGKYNKRNLCTIADKSTSRFLEYWFPVQISNHQLEQYCALLLSNSTTLRSCTKNDPVRSLRDTLPNFRKCCDHPYLLDLSFQERLINKEKRQAPEVLDIAIKASGKFEVLDMMLTEIKTRGSQVLILFQSILGEKTSSSDILAEYLDKRFGEHSFEHVDTGFTPSKKQASVNRFNKKENGVFVFLLENRACSSGLKLLSLDTIIIYHSDWNPLNDLKALQKISIQSKFERIKVFRLYSSFTVEERSLILSKKNVNIDNSLQTSGRAIVDNLLMWGASHLFDKLSDYHAESTSSLNVSSQQFFLTEVIEEFRSILSESCENSESPSVISKVQLDVGGYKTNIPLFGETKVTLEEGKEPHVFWRSLLDRKLPRWKLLGELCPRIRKKVHNLDGSPNEPDTGNGNVGNKRRKVVNGNVDPASVQVELNEYQATQVADHKEGPSTVVTCNQSQFMQTNGVTATSSLNSNQRFSGTEVNALESAEKDAWSDEQKNLHSSLLADVMRLGHTLKLSEDIIHMARRFLEYIIKNHHISNSPAIVQAFQISLCWHAASISKQKVDKKDSFDLAKKVLDYECTEEQAESVYLKMRPLKRTYLQSMENTYYSHRDRSVAEEDILRQPSNVDAGRGGWSEIDKILKIQKKCLKRQKKLLRKQQEKIQEVHQIWETKKLELVKNYQVQKSFIRLLHDEGSVRMKKLKHLDDSFAKKMEEHDILRDVELKNLEADQLVTMNEEKQKAERWLAEAKACSSEQGTIKVPFSQSAINTTVGARSVVDESSQHLEDQNSREGVCTQQNDAALANTFMSAPAEEVGCDVPTETRSLVTSYSQNEVGVTDIDGSSLDMFKQSNQPNHYCDNEELVCTELPVSKDQSVDLARGSRVEVPETALSKNVSRDKINSSSAELLNQNELDLQNKNNSQPEVHAQEPVDALTAVQSNGELKEGGLEEGKIQEEGELQNEEPPAEENQSTVNSESVAIVDPVPTVEQSDGNVVTLVNQLTSEIQVETLLPVDSLTNALTVELQDQETPALEYESSSEVPNSVLVDTVVPVQHVDSLTNAPNSIELQDQGVTLEVANSDLVDTVDPVWPITELHADAPTVENGGTSLVDVPIREAADTVIPLQSNIKVTTLVNSVDVSPSCNQPEADHPNSNQRRNSSQTVEAAEADLLLDEPVLQSENLYMSIDPHQSAELPTSSQNIVAISQTVYGAADSSNEAVLQEGNVNHHQRSAYLVHQTAHPTFFCEPLKGELEKMSKEKDHLVKSHADTGLRLRSDCEKEIEEVTKQIKQKYEMKLQEAEAELGLRKNELEKNQNKILLNMKLAWAFRDKGLDVRPSGHQQGTPVYMHQPSMQSLLRPLRTQLSLPHPSRSSSVANHSAPPVQAVQHTSALLSTPPHRPPVISSFTPHNPRMSGEIRAPAPHLQSFRPSMGPTPSLTSPCQTLLPPTAQLSVPQPSPNRPGPQVGLPAQSSLFPAMALLRQMENRHLVLPEVGLTCTSSEQSDLGVRGNVQGRQSSPAVGKDVVCLSDDD